MIEARFTAAHLKVADHGGGAFADVVPDQSGLASYREEINADVLDAWYDPSPRVVKALQEALPWSCRTSPPVFGRGLRQVIGQQRGIDPANILVAGGSSEIIHLVARHLFNSSSRVVILDPMYGEYSYVLDELVGCDVSRYRLRPEENFEVGIEAFVRFSRGADAVILVNPNNPTGFALSREQLISLKGQLDERTLLVVDETYIDFVLGRPSVEALVAEIPNLVVIKSMSKFYALSGLRVGYLVAPCNLIDQLARFLPPWAVSLPAQIAATEAIGDEAYYQSMAVQTDILRLDLVRELLEVSGIRVFEGAANYVLVELLAPQLGATRVVADLRAHRIHIRNCATQGPSLGDRFVRTAVKDAASNRKIAEGFRCVLRSA